MLLASVHAARPTPAHMWGIAHAWGETGTAWLGMGWRATGIAACAVVGVVVSVVASMAAGVVAGVVAGRIVASHTLKTLSSTPSNTLPLTIKSRKFM